ncbi:TPA: type II toxin-antitoxin system YafQ family toxin, partial [Legionella pneumophila]|nr:type II toxin-antitoxin system YafQ family toxin [Legionella pneumophila]
LKNCDHLLSGDWRGFRECHISPDWLLIYKNENELKLLRLVRTGSHSDLFR